MKLTWVVRSAFLFFAVLLTCIGLSAMEETTSPSGVGEPPSHSSCDKPNFSLVLLVLVLGPGDGDNFVPLTVLVPTLSALRLTPHEPAKLNACTSQFHVIVVVTLSVACSLYSC